MPAGMRVASPRAATVGWGSAPNQAVRPTASNAGALARLHPVVTPAKTAKHRRVFRLKAGPVAGAAAARALCGKLTGQRCRPVR